MSDNDAEVAFKIPKDLIRATVIGELANQAGDPGKVFANMVAGMLVAKTGRIGYDDVPLWKAMMHDCIKGAAKEVFKEMLEEQKPKIKEALRKKLSGARYASRLADALVEAVTPAYLSINVNMKDTRE